MAQSSGTPYNGITSSDALEGLNMTVLSAGNLPQSSGLHRDPKAFVALSVLDKPWKTKIADRSKNPRWGDEFNLLGGDSAVLKFELKVLRRFGLSHREVLVGTLEMRFEELREKQRKAHEEGRNYFTLDLQAILSSGPRPSISVQVHGDPLEAEQDLDTARVLVSTARGDIQEMRTLSGLPAVPAHASDAASSAQDAVQAVGSAKEVQEVYKAALASIEAFVKVVDAFAEIHPYAKAAWTVLSAGYKIIAAQQGRDDALSELLDSMSTAFDLVCRFDKTALHKDDKCIILQVAKKANECALFIQEYCRTKSFALRAVKGVFSGTDDEISRFKRDFDILRRNMDTGAILSLTEGLSRVNEDLYKVEEGMKDIGLNVVQMAILDKLPYAAGATWDRGKTCLPSTREALLEDIWQWITSSEPRDGAEILCLTGVAGSGKSAIAHTIASRCYDEGFLASSFFFSQDVAERNNPRKLLTTIARDIARDPRIRERICLALERDLSLVTAPLSQQFDSLILAPCLHYPPDAFAAMVIDGLDEGYTVELLKIFRSAFPKLPQPFRLFITSRDMAGIETILSHSAHFHLRTIDINTSVNLGDMRTYIRHGLTVIAEQHGLGESWVSEELVEVFVSKAEGLFQWAAAVFQALETAYNPTKKLISLLADTRTGLAPEKKMDNIYTKILEAFDWDDDDFKSDFHAVMGAILAAKSPLSVSALRSLHPDISDIGRLFSRLGALLTGWKHPGQPVRILHLSLRDFLTARAPKNAPFYICEKDHSRRLGLLCLRVLSEKLTEGAPGVGYLADDTVRGIPILDKAEVSEELSYACEFWMDHIVEFKAPIPAKLVEPLHNLLFARLIPWMEVHTSIATFKGFQQVRTWIQQNMSSEGANLMNEEFTHVLGAALVQISERLDCMERREEALTAGREAVDLYRQLATDRPAAHNSSLAHSLRNLSRALSHMGHGEDALAAVTEAVQLFRPLAADRSALFSLNLAESLDTLSACLSSLGHKKRALIPAREAVQLYRRLAEDRPTVFRSKLAFSLNELAVDLSAVGHREDALAAV
ncbi:hypothetical protein BOTBODRAFT_33830 [Botryobasidium botryosum FD-172 SS1]|uniref:C2 domain-containing protein n=1 Tax=Botryobasidium botryosum (strain FD-172 SS1) TaxID=930990 RepID=A0A067MCC4_BOTB1|nr:hypothetical protein BOTBODRAFT_33830 [Botryobasidium botryosum FD-172 SS1]